ncbi:MAG TPA: hypothetical protein VEB43_19875 [Anaeromyxobacter sp.]|nr:hypothetical protein [Anaeromyxobacter sp.]
MERDTRQTVEPPRPPERYEPPAVEWEEPFDPVALSTDCCNPLDPLCDNPCGGG